MKDRVQLCKTGDFSLGQVHEFMGAFGRAGGYPDLLQDVIEDAEKMKQLVAILQGKQEMNISVLLKEWERFYKEEFDIDVDFSDLHVPEYQKGFDRLIVVAQGMKPQMLYDKCAELFTCGKWTEDDLDKIVKSDRIAEAGHYAVWLRGRVEADEELKNKSANMLKEEEILGITLEERFLYELKYFKETGAHLDIKNATLCSGSLYSGGVVPRVDWSDGRLKVFGCHPDSRNDDYIRTRAAVILET